MTSKPKWTDRIFSPIRVLNHADGLHLEKFTDADLDQIADCDDILEIDLRSNRTAQPVDLSRLAHIQGLRRLSLERLKVSECHALQRQMPQPGDVRQPRQVYRLSRAVAAHIELKNVITVGNLVQIGIGEFLQMQAIRVVQHANGATEAVGPLWFRGHKGATGSGWLGGWRGSLPVTPGF